MYFLTFTFAISPVSPPEYVQVRQKGESFAFPLGQNFSDNLHC